MNKTLFKGIVIDGAGSDTPEHKYFVGNLIEEQSTGRTFIVDLARFDENTKLVDIIVEVEPDSVVEVEK